MTKVEIRCQKVEMRCQFIILARKEEPTPDYARVGAIEDVVDQAAVIRSSRSSHGAKAIK